MWMSYVHYVYIKLPSCIYIYIYIYTYRQLLANHTISLLDFILLFICHHIIHCNNRPIYAYVLWNSIELFQHCKASLSILLYTCIERIVWSPRNREVWWKYAEILVICRSHVACSCHPVGTTCTASLFP